MTVLNLTNKLVCVPISEMEAARYLSARGDDVAGMIRDAGELCENAVRAAAVYEICDVNISTDRVDLGIFSAKSRDLAKNLSGCKGAIVFCATVGIEFDRLVLKYSNVSPSKSVCIDAVGSERVEALCDLLCAEFTEKYGALRPRFSPGYGDLDINIQREIFAALDCPRQIGLSLNESMLMTPKKSVTAIVGVEG